MIQQIINVFEGFRMDPLPIDEYESKGKALLEEKMSRFINSGKPIEFAMLGYPMKSSNDRDKVIGKIPDLAEEVSINNFKTFNEAIKNVYSPGVKVKIINDGYVFNDLLKVEDTTVEHYQEITKELSKGSSIEWFTLKDFYNKSLNEDRSMLMEHFGITTIELEKRILFDPDVNSLYRGMMRFMEEELAIQNFPSRNQLHKAAKILTRDMMMRNEAYSNLVKKEFGDSIRLSMHPSVNNGNKYSFKLIPGSSQKVWTSPWHCALLIDKDNEYVTIHKKDAIKAGYTLEYRNNQPYNFREEVLWK